MLLSCLGIMERIRRDEDLRGLDLDCRIRGDRCDFIWAPTGHSSALREAYQVYFQKDLASRPYLFLVSRNRLLCTKTFFCP